MRPASDDAHNEMSHTKGVRIGKSRDGLDLSNDTRLFFVIAQQTQ